MKIKIAVVGATGLVGSTIINVLRERNLKEVEYLFAASAKSVGKKLLFGEKEYIIISVEEAIEAAPQIAIFSAGSGPSLLYAPRFAEKGTYVIDNSSAWRMNTKIPLVVPEINGNRLTSEDKIIANPNCSTIQLVMALCPLHNRFKIKRVVVSTYQSVTGTGVKAVEQLLNERKEQPTTKVYPHPIDLNILPHAGSFNADGYTTEEEKLLNETRKILNDSSINLTATVVRVPVMGGHSESVNIEFANEFHLEDIKNLLSEMQGVVVLDDPQQNLYPMPLFAQGKDEVFVGRIRRDFSQPNSLNMWIVSDNLRKGAATNAIQIAELIRKKFLS